MTIDLSRYAGSCPCGRKHALLTKEILIESGATGKLPQIAQLLSLPQSGVVVCDDNTLPYAEKAAAVLNGFLLPSQPVVCLPADGLHADEKATALLESALSKDAGWLLAAGSGTIHDTTRYVANERGISFLSYPTAASVDGFVSTVSAMTWYGFKKTLPGVAPLAVVADTDIFSAAPYRLTAAGIGDVLGKYTSLADWEISHIVTGEAYCGQIASLSREAVDNVLENLSAIRSGDPKGMESLMFALLLSGIAMQLWGNSRPASGAEHHLSHLWEMEAINDHIDALHGEKVGVGLNLVLAEYKRIGGLEPLRPISAYTGLPHDTLKQFGRLCEDVVTENNPDPLAEITPAKLEAAIPAIKKIISALPDAAQISREMQSAGCHTSVEQIGLTPAIIPQSLTLSPFVRNRLTLMRLRKLLEV